MLHLVTHFGQYKNVLKSYAKIRTEKSKSCNLLKSQRYTYYSLTVENSLKITIIKRTKWQKLKRGARCDI